MPSAHKSRVLRKRAKRNETVYNYAIALACDKFLKTRGMTAQRENFNRWNTEGPRTDGLPLRERLRITEASTMTQRPRSVSERRLIWIMLFFLSVSLELGSSLLAFKI
jgi:hypothetical protein